MWKRIGNKLQTLLFAGGLLFSFAGELRAQEVETSVNKNPVSSGDRFRYTIVLKNVKGKLQPPSFDAFPQVYGSSRSRSVQMINGQVSREMRHIYTIQAPREAGTYRIPAPELVTQEGTLKGDPIELKVKEGASKGKSSGQDDGPKLSQSQKSKRLIGRIRTNKTSAYKGEEILITYELYSRYRSIGFSKQEFPSITGAWSEEVETSVGWEDGVERIDGKPYKKAVLRRSLIYPQKSGTLRIDPMKLNCEVNRGFFRKGKSMKVKSNNPSIEIKPLPEGAPQSFKGDVGKFELHAELDEKKSKIDGSVNLKVRIRGRGNLDLINAPEVEIPPELESYDPETDRRMDVSRNGISGHKEWEYLIIPRQGGDYEIGPVEFSYFDPDNGEYKTLQAGPFELHVSDERAKKSERVPKEKVRSVEEDLRYLHELDDLRGKKGSVGKGLLDIGLLLPPLAGALFLLFLSYRRKHGEKERRSRKSARKRLKEAEKALSRGDRPAFHEETHKALQEYLAERTGLPLSEMNKDRLRERMLERGIEEERSERALRILEECEELRYAPGTEVPDDKVHERTVSLIAELEESWT